jgi:hypothetical protein
LSRSVLGYWRREWARPAGMLAATVLLAVLVRAPFNANVGVDEAFYLVVGRQWLHGTPPYAGSFDVKPPLLFLLMGGAEALLGPGLWAKALATASAALPLAAEDRRPLASYLKIVLERHIAEKRREHEKKESK